MATGLRFENGVNLGVSLNFANFFAKFALFSAEKIFAKFAPLSANISTYFRFLHPFWAILGHLRVPRCLSGPIQGKVTHGGSPGGCSCCFLSAARLLVPSWGCAILIFMKIRLGERHQTPEYNARYLPPNSFLAVTFLNQA